VRRSREEGADVVGWERRKERKRTKDPAEGVLDRLLLSPQIDSA